MTDIPCKTGNLRSTEITNEKIERRLFRRRDDLHVKEPLAEVKIIVSPGNGIIDLIDVCGDPIRGWKMGHGESCPIWPTISDQPPP